jgi:hypothetical protein
MKMYRRGKVAIYWDCELLKVLVYYTYDLDIPRLTQ